MVQNCLRAHSLRAKLGLEVTVADARFCQPLDIDLIRQLCENHAFLITVEEGAIGGFGSHVAQFISLDGQLDAKMKWRPITLPDSYIQRCIATGTTFCSRFDRQPHCCNGIESAWLHL